MSETILATVKDLEIVACFFEDRQTGFAPKKIHLPDVDLQSSISVAQSE